MKDKYILAMMILIIVLITVTVILLDQKKVDDDIHLAPIKVENHRKYKKL